MLPKIGVLIPAYNASDTILELIHRISAYLPQNDIVVVDDGSQDQTYNIIRKTQAVVLKHHRNRGKGEALKTGFDHAFEKGYDHLITLDSDLQHDPVFIQSFVDQVRNKNSDIILGTRGMNLKIMPFINLLTNKLTSILISISTGRIMKDTQSGYRLTRVKVFNSLDLKSKKYDLESEILLKAGRKELKIDSVHISTIYTGGRSFISPIADTLRFIFLLWRSLWW
ncbi:MAG: glycosyltransferase family 2 protein [Candidatus Zixiibacteriota bacterium]